MSLLETEGSTGILDTPDINLIYGPAGIGKTTWACSFPDVAILDAEKGSKHINVKKRFDKLPDLETLRKYISSFRNDVHSFQTLVIDSTEAVETLIIDQICNREKCETIEKAMGGFGKGFTNSREIMTEIMHDLRDITEQRGMTVNLVGHSQEKQFTDPLDGSSYNRYTLRTNDKMTSIIFDLSDNVYFASRKVFVNEVGNKSVGVSDGKPTLCTIWRPSAYAKNRIPGIASEISMDNYQIYADAKKNAKLDINSLRAELLVMAKGISDTTTAKAAIEKINSAPTLEELTKIKNRLSQVIKQVA